MLDTINMSTMCQEKQLRKCSNFRSRCMGCFEKLKANTFPCPFCAFCVVHVSMQAGMKIPLPHLKTKLSPSKRNEARKKKKKAQKGRERERDHQSQQLVAPSLEELKRLDDKDARIFMLHEQAKNRPILQICLKLIRLVLAIHTESQPARILLSRRFNCPDGCISVVDLRNAKLKKFANKS